MRRMDLSMDLLLEMQRKLEGASVLRVRERGTAEAAREPSRRSLRECKVEKTRTEMKDRYETQKE